jgi:phosphoribosylformimino-5-aminoimidazole carboxamide ribotide isomerase
MDLIPAIDIRGGRVVQLVQGDYGRETVYGDDPVAMALHWVRLGAHRLHIVDLDGAKEGRPVNDAAIAGIVEAAGVDVRVQVAGGVRDEAAVERWLAAGAARVIIGTMAVRDPGAVARAVQAHGDQIAVAVDVRDGKPAVQGWLETSDQPVDGFLREMAARGVRHFIYTDISRDGMLQHLNFVELKRLIGVLGEAAPDTTLIYSGGVTSIEDVITLGSYGIEGAIIGTALYDGRLDFREARYALVTGDGTA